MSRPLSVEELASRLPPKARLIGIDLGTKTIGLALSDVERRIASPLKTLPRTAFQKDADALLAIFAEFEIAAVILGAKPRREDRSADRLVGRALLDRRRPEVADRKRRLAGAARRGGRQDGRSLYFAGRARSPLGAPQGAVNDFLRISSGSCDLRLVFSRKTGLYRKKAKTGNRRSAGGRRPLSLRGGRKALLQTHCSDGLNGQPPRVPQA